MPRPTGVASAHAPRLLVRRPSPRLADGELTHLDRVPIDPVLAALQWGAYVDVYRGRGWEIVEAPAADDHPDGVFIEDAIVVFDDLAVLTRPGAPSRRGEVSSLRAVAEALALYGARPDAARVLSERQRAEASALSVVSLEAPGTLEGGDVLKVGRTVYVGASSRTNAAGIAQLRALIEPRGWTVVEVPVTRVLHLKSAVTALPDGTVLGYEPLVDDPSLFAAFLAVPEQHGTAVVVLDEHTVLMSADAPATTSLLRERGLDVITTPVSEFEKLEGCVTCLSVRVR